MLRRCRWQCSRGLLAPCRSELFVFHKAKGTELHRLSRQRPWWENAAIFTGLLLFMNAMSLVYYVGNRWYQAWRPSGNDIYVKNAVNAKLFSRPDLAVAAVQMTMYHVLTRSSRPFGAPMIAPESARAEAEELADFILGLHSEQPAFSIPDLWALLSTRALARIGGPHETPTRGRSALQRRSADAARTHSQQGAVEVSSRGACAASGAPPAKHDDVIAVVPSPVAESTRDILALKRVLASQGFTAGQIVAIMGCVRGIGFHAAARYHTKSDVKPSFSGRKAAPASSPCRDDSVEDVWQKCTPDPFVFSSTYFDLLLDYNWVKVGGTSRWIRHMGGAEVYRCSEKNRRRHITLLDPFSERFDAMRRSRRSDATALTDNGEESTMARRGDTGRSGEAVATQWTPLPVRSAQCAPLDASDCSNNEEEYVTVNSPEHIDPCPMISMQGIDMALLDDALTRGWVHRFSVNELELYSVVGDVMVDIQRRGYKPSDLSTWA